MRRWTGRHIENIEMRCVDSAANPCLAVALALALALGLAADGLGYRRALRACGHGREAFDSRVDRHATTRFAWSA